MNIAILIPVYNESQTIEELVKRVKAFYYDVIVVDDGSVDGSADLARKAGAEVLSHQNNKGKGYSLKQGFAYICNKKFDGVIVMDADGQHDPDDLEKFIEAIKQNPNRIINGNRMHDAQHMPYVRRCTNKVMSWMISRLCGQKIPDTQCGYRYIGRDVLDRLDLKTQSFEIETEILIQSARLSVPIHSVPIKVIYADEDSKINPILDTIRFFSYLLKECFHRS